MPNYDVTITEEERVTLLDLVEEENLNSADNYRRTQRLPVPSAQVTWTEQSMVERLVRENIRHHANGMRQPRRRKQLPEMEE